ncbi:MAG: response regulator, partial [Pseudomonadales bacterium]|nr:response regulator [Pseudomonadales bacterium]
TLTVMSAPLGILFEVIMLSFALAYRIKRTQKEVLHSDQEAMANLSKYQSIFDNSQVGMYQMTPSGVVTVANKYFSKIFGFSKTGDFFKNRQELLNTLYSLSKEQSKTFIKDKILVNDITFTNINEEKLWVNHRSQAIYNNEGALDHIEGILINNTETKKKETAVKNRLKERIAKEFAIASTQQKSKFLSTMSHNIRIPLTAIIGYSEYLQEDELDKNERDDYINTVAENSRILLHLINNILDFSKIEAGKFDVEAIPTNLSDIIEKLNDEYSPKAKHKDITFRLEQQYPYPENILSDPTKTYQILSNLCDNAIKATNKGEVKTSISWSNDSLTFTVSDTGIGMSPSTVETLFAQEQGVEGGLGLIISSRLSKLLGGDITCHSKIGKGSTFNFVIKPTLPKNVLWINKKITVQKDNVKGIPNLTGTVLLAEDNVVNQRIIEKVLKKSGVEVIVVNDGLEACEYCDSNNPDFILMDINMPNLDGLEATKYLREKQYTMPIFALSAETDKQKIDAALTAGCEGALSKPLDKKALYKTLAKYLPSGKRKASH